uniref:Uncharacterized protein n=1 Tax=Rhizophora mucronata TaxID=61149 RepID=A0A2P2JZF7_RHIMU
MASFISVRPSSFNSGFFSFVFDAGLNNRVSASDLRCFFDVTKT